MKHLALIAVLCLLAGTSEGTFETKDPALPVENAANNEKAKPAVPKGGVEVKVIVPVGTNLYVPNIVLGECDGWRFDESEPGMGEGSYAGFTSNTTYIGTIMKTIDCINEVDGSTLLFALVQVENGRLIWVELERVLYAD